MTLSIEMINGLFAVGGAVVGAIIAGLFAIYVARSTKDKKEIVISTSRASRLLVIDDQIASDVEIRVSGSKVENVILSKIFLSNTGNKAVENLRFVISCQKGVQIFSMDALDQATDTPRSGSSIARTGSQEFVITVDYINPGEEMVLRCLVSGEEPEWNVSLRQAGLRVIRRTLPVASSSDVVAEIVVETLLNVPILSTYLRITSPVIKRFFENRP